MYQIFMLNACADLQLPQGGLLSSIRCIHAISSRRGNHQGNRAGSFIQTYHHFNTNRNLHSAMNACAMLYLPLAMSMMLAMVSTPSISIGIVQAQALPTTMVGSGENNFDQNGIANDEDGLEHDGDSNTRELATKKKGKSNTKASSTIDRNLYCVRGCMKDKIGNGKCNPKCNNKRCRFDGGDCEGYSIQLEYMNPNLKQKYRMAFEQARQRWQKIIKTEFPQNSIAYKGIPCAGVPMPKTVLIDDLLIFVQVRKIDGRGGWVGGATFCGFDKSGDFTFPRIGIMIFDSDDMEELAKKELLDDVVLHEMGHVIGVGTLWGPNFNNLITQTYDPPYFYTGKYGKEGEKLVGGLGYPLIENDLGSASAQKHWHEGIYDTELMTSVLDKTNLLSNMTLMSLMDLGYKVDLSMADKYVVPDPEVPREVTSNLRTGEQKEEDDDAHVDLGDCGLMNAVEYPPFQVEKRKKKPQR